MIPQHAIQALTKDVSALNKRLALSRVKSSERYERCL